MDLDTMVETQIVARGVHDRRLLEVMRTVPRDLFVMENDKTIAFTDQPLPIGYGQTISQPYIVAYMTELLDLCGDETVLEIGTGSGYQSAILSRLVKKVYSVERIAALADFARQKLSKLGYDNVEVLCCDGFTGLDVYGPYDSIIVTCAPSEIPLDLIEQLKDGGRMVVPVGIASQSLKLIFRHGEKILIKDSLSVRFVPMLKGID